MFTDSAEYTPIDEFELNLDLDAEQSFISPDFMITGKDLRHVDSAYIKEIAMCVADHITGVINDSDTHDILLEQVANELYQGNTPSDAGALHVHASAHGGTRPTGKGLENVDLFIQHLKSALGKVA